MIFWVDKMCIAHEWVEEKKSSSYKAYWKKRICHSDAWLQVMSANITEHKRTNRSFAHMLTHLATRTQIHIGSLAIAHTFAAFRMNTATHTSAANRKRSATINLLYHHHYHHHLQRRPSYYNQLQMVLEFRKWSQQRQSSLWSSHIIHYSAICVIIIIFQWFVGSSRHQQYAQIEGKNLY